MDPNNLRSRKFIEHINRLKEKRRTDVDAYARSVKIHLSALSDQRTAFCAWLAFTDHWLKKIPRVWIPFLGLAQSSPEVY